MEKRKKSISIMNIKNLLNPAYMFARARLWSFQRRFPDAPWLTDSAVLFFDSWLKPEDIGIEWGSGRSTAWLAAKVKKLISVESDDHYQDMVLTLLDKEGLRDKVDYRYIPLKVPQKQAPRSHPYADVVLEVADESLDFALVDGKIRILCMEKAIPKIKQGGVLVLDNSERFISDKAKAGRATIASPMKDFPDERLKELLRTLKN